ncbi:Mor transcription activator domain protein [Nitratidesulfovibrio vulgaris RCH1]|nr:Mor transcription activator domain protein [Nitratidesulfovibrio vulgaris RCH1]
MNLLPGMPSRPALSEAALPAAAREIAALVGLPKTLQLVERLGGTTFPVPKRATKVGELRYFMLADVVGVEAADLLCRHYGGTNLYVPRCAEALRKARDAEIVATFDRETKEKSASAVVAELALRYRLSDRRIWLILKEVPVLAVMEHINPARRQGRLL